jgi:hypothetical protein
VARHIFQACLVWIYTQSNITSILNHDAKLSLVSILSLLFLEYKTSVSTLVDVRRETYPSFYI